MEGRRREDCRLGDLPDDLEPGDYWRYVDGNGDPLKSTDPGNLTGGVWGVRVPGDRTGIGMLTKHTVREHEDGTISVRPGDGSSNSIRVTVGTDEVFHGYIDHGVWEAV